MKLHETGMFTSNTNEWFTPPELFFKLDKEFKFTLDPAASLESARTPMFFTKDMNGLTRSWQGHNVFLNPPYGREIKHWVKKAYLESLKSNTIVVMLIPARTDTIYWHEYIFPYALDIRFLKGRIKFGKLDHTGKIIFKDPAPFPSAIVVF